MVLGFWVFRFTPLSVSLIVVFKPRFKVTSQELQNFSVLVMLHIKYCFSPCGLAFVFVIRDRLNTSPSDLVPRSHINEAGLFQFAGSQF